MVAVSAIEVRAAVAARNVELDVEFVAGQCTAIIGANGAGKSTLLGLIWGLIKPSSGTVRIGGETVADGGAGAFVPTHRRDIGLLAQDPLLFPHMSVIENVEFGLRSRGLGKTAARAIALEHLEGVGCVELAEKNAGEVSGGQAQRIGLARALAPEPAVFLLDEPLAALDAVTAPQMREVLRQNIAGRTTALVTHDLLDVLVLAQRVVVLNGGRVVAAGATAEVFGQPRDAFLAEFLGVNVLAGKLVREADTDYLQIAPETALAGIGAKPDGAGWASFPASAVTLHRVAPGGSARNALRANVVAIEPRGPIQRVVCDLAGQQVVADVTGQSVASLQITVGQQVWLAIKATAVALY